jgi:Zn finger protein HypA/HybF involved in hydrogenase expression
MASVNTPVHEMGTAKDLVLRALEEMTTAGASRVTGVSVRLGPDGAYQAEALDFSIRAAAVGTPAEGAKVVIRPAKDRGVVLESVEVEVGD